MMSAVWCGRGVGWGWGGGRGIGRRVVALWVRVLQYENGGNACWGGGQGPQWLALVWQRGRWGRYAPRRNGQGSDAREYGGCRGNATCVPNVGCGSGRSGAGANPWWSGAGGQVGRWTEVGIVGIGAREGKEGVEGRGRHGGWSCAGWRVEERGQHGRGKRACSCARQGPLSGVTWPGVWQVGLARVGRRGPGR